MGRLGWKEASPPQASCDSWTILNNNERLVHVSFKRHQHGSILVGSGCWMASNWVSALFFSRTFLFAYFPFRALSLSRTWQQELMLLCIMGSVCSQFQILDRNQSQLQLNPWRCQDSNASVQPKERTLLLGVRVDHDVEATTSNESGLIDMAARCLKYWMARWPSWMTGW
jgi:hypothetical protein